jgi:regulatory protein
MIITKIERQKRNSTRRSIFLNDKYSFSVSEDIYTKYALYVEQELTEDEIEAITQEETELSVKRIALRFRSYRPRSKKELTEYLQKKGYDDKYINTALDFLSSNKLLDDEEFARMFCRDKLNLKPVGKLMMKQLLFKKGILKTTIDSVLSDFYSKESERELAEKEASKKYHRVSSLPSLTIKKRIFDHLVRRGYDSSLSLSIANSLVKR